MARFRAHFDLKNYNTSAREIELSEDESRHLCGSLRAREGDRVDAFDLSGNIFKCALIKADKKRAKLSVEEKIPQAQRECQIFLLQCLPKGKTFDDIIRQSVELGISGIHPIISRFSQVKLTDQDATKKREKWQTQVIEAVKQSSNFSGFEIFTPISFEKLFASLPDFDLKIVASLQSDAKNIACAFRDLKEMPKKIAVLIGPEGDMSQEEYTIASQLGFIPVTLGKNVLKSETAAICALSQVIAGIDFISK